MPSPISDFAYLRPQPVGADEGGACEAAPVLERDLHPFAVILEAGDARAGLQRHGAFGLARLDQGEMQVGTVDDGIGIVEDAPEGVGIEGDAGDEIARERVHHDEGIGVDTGRIDGFGEAQHLEHVKGVGPDLDAGAHLAEFFLALQHVR